MKINRLFTIGYTCNEISETTLNHNKNIWSITFYLAKPCCVGNKDDHLWREKFYVYEDFSSSSVFVFTKL